MDPAQVMNEFAERFRQLGREEVLREVAKLPTPLRLHGSDPDGWTVTCQWCFVIWDLPDDADDHTLGHPDSDCLWSQAARRASTGSLSPSAPGVDPYAV